MTAIEPQKAEGKVLFHFTMSLDGFVAGPGHALDWMTGFTGRDGVEEEYIATTGAVLGGRDGWDLDPTARPYSADWQGAVFVLTHHPEDAVPAEGVTFLNCDVAEAIRIGLEAAGGKNLEILSPNVGRQAARARPGRRDRPPHRTDPARRRHPGVRQPGRAARSGCGTPRARTRSPRWTCATTPLRRRRAMSTTGSRRRPHEGGAPS